MNPRTVGKNELKKEAAERFIAYGYLKGMDRIQYGSIKAHTQ